jgi:hypothetical protein
MAHLTALTEIHIRRNADVGITPIMPTFELCRPGCWFACCVGGSVLQGAA